MKLEQIYEYEEGREASRELLIEGDTKDKEIIITAQETLKYDDEGNSIQFNEVPVQLSISDAKQLVVILSKWLYDLGMIS